MVLFFIVTWFLCAYTAIAIITSFAEKMNFLTTLVQIPKYVVSEYRKGEDKVNKKSLIICLIIPFIVGPFSFLILLYLHFDGLFEELEEEHNLKMKNDLVYARKFKLRKFPS